MNKVFPVSCLLIVGLISGCGNFNSIHRPIEIDSGKGALIDAKQRGVFVSTNRTTTTTKTSTLENPNDYKIETKSEVISKICAEPSPDAMSAYAMQLAAEGKVPEGVAGKLALNSQESASFIGLRTQSIQVLRDSMYRICEAYLSGGIDESHFELMLRRSQRYMVALLGIEQLTGVVKVPPVIINTSGSTSISRPTSEIREEIKLIDKNISDLKTKESTTQDEKLKTEIKKDIQAAESDKKILEDMMQKPDAISTTGSATATVIVNATPTQRGDAHIQTVANNVTSIVKSVIETDDTEALCFSLLSNSSTQNLTGLQNICLKQFQTKADLNAARLKAGLDQLNAAKTPQEKEKAKVYLDDLSKDLGLGIRSELSNM